MKKGTFIALSVICTIIALTVLAAALVFGAENKAINLEEQINDSKSAIEVQEKRRVDLIHNLVDTVQAYDKHESSTLAAITEARTKAKEGNVAEAQMAIQAVAEAYPDLKSQANYQTLMHELATTENLVAEYRNNFNTQVKAYNKHVRKFPNRTLLSLIGYEKIDAAQYLEYDSPTDAPQDLFKDDTTNNDGE